MILNGVYKANCQFWDTLWKTENVFCCCCLFTQNDWLELTSRIPKPRFQHGTAISQRGESSRGCVMHFTEINWAFALNYFRKVRLQTASLKGKHSSSFRFYTQWHEPCSLSHGSYTDKSCEHQYRDEHGCERVPYSYMETSYIVRAAAANDFSNSKIKIGIWFCLWSTLVMFLKWISLFYCKKKIMWTRE